MKADEKEEGWKEVKLSKETQVLFRSSWKLHEIANKIMSQAHSLNKQQHPELLDKEFMFTKDNHGMLYRGKDVKWRVGSFTYLSSNIKEKTQMSENEQKCPECNIEMKYIADFPTGRESWGVEISVYLYQCPKCKTVKTWSDD